MKPLLFLCLLGVLSTAGQAIAASKSADCSVARDPRRCAAKETAREACSGLQGQARSTCVREALPPPDCSHAPNSTQCQARQAAAEACKEKKGQSRRQCIRSFNR